MAVYNRLFVFNTYFVAQARRTLKPNEITRRIAYVLFLETEQLGIIGDNLIAKERATVGMVTVYVRICIGILPARNETVKRCFLIGCTEGELLYTICYWLISLILTADHSITKVSKLQIVFITVAFFLSFSQASKKFLERTTERAFRLATREPSYFVRHHAFHIRRWL